MVCLIRDIPDHSSEMLTSAAAAAALSPKPSMTPPPFVTSNTTGLISMHERVVMLERSNERLRYRINQMKGRRRKRLRESRLPMISSSDLVDGMLLLSIATLVIVVGKLVLA